MKAGKPDHVWSLEELLRWRHSNGVTLFLLWDAYLLIRPAHGLSPEAKSAVDAATKHLYGWEVSCPPAVAEELRTWFDDCGEHHRIRGHPYRWIVRACDVATRQIEKALSDSGG